MSLLDVTLQHGQQLAQLSLSICWVLRVLDAVMDVGMNQPLSERFQPTSRRDDLRQNFAAIAILFQHAFDGGELARDLSGTHDRGAPFFGRMDMRIHNTSLSSKAHEVKKTSREGGIWGYSPSR